MSQPPTLDMNQSLDPPQNRLGLSLPNSSHLDDALAEATGDSGTIGIDGAAAPDGGNGFIDRDVWCTGFLGAHKMVGQATGLGTLIAAPELPGGMDAAGALYDSIVDTPMLHFMVRPGSLWLQRTMLIGAFYVPIVGGVRAELRARRATDITPEGEHQAQPEPAMDGVVAT